MDMKLIKGLFFALLLSPSLLTYAADEADPIDEQEVMEDAAEIEAMVEAQEGPTDKACGTIMCIFGETVGQSGGERCDGYIDDYFDIKKYRHGAYSPSRTARARVRYLNRCNSELSRAFAGAINGTFATWPDNPF